MDPILYGKIKKASSPSDSQVTNAINAYLAKNPVEAYDDTEIKVKIAGLSNVFTKKSTIVFTKENSTYVEGKRVNSTTGELPSLGSWAYVEIDVSGYTRMQFKGYSTGSSNLGYAFYDSSKTFISGANTNILPDTGYDISIPSGAVYFRYAMPKDSWLDPTLDSFIVINENDSNAILEKKVEAINSKDYMLPLGNMDNYLTDKWNGYGIYKSVDGTEKAITGIAVGRNDSGEPITITNEAYYHTSSNNTVKVKSTMFLKIKKNGSSDRYFFVRDQNGANANFSESTLSGTIIKQNVTNNPVTFGKVIENTSDYITVYFYPQSNTYVLHSYSDSSKTSYDKLEIDINRSGIFLETLDETDIEFNRKYYSRSEKLHSLVRGKTAIVFTDSQVAFCNSLVNDFGMNLIVIGGSGCRMGYESGTGAGGETGTADTLWLCNDTRIQKFNTNFGSLTKVDYIINATGFNGTLTDISNATELKYVLANKRWFGDTSDTNVFDSLSDDNKARFTSQACYIAAFCTLIKKYPMALPVVCDLYRTGGETSKFTSGVWNSNDELVDAIYDEGRLQKNVVLEQLSDQIGSIFVNASRNGLGVINCPTYAPDGVHSVMRTAINFATNIVNAISYPDYTGDRTDLTTR